LFKDQGKEKSSDLGPMTGPRLDRKTQDNLDAQGRFYEKIERSWPQRRIGKWGTERVKEWVSERMKGLGSGILKKKRSLRFGLTPPPSLT